MGGITSPLQWTVDFGDGTAASHSAASPLRVPKTHGAPGTYTVRVTVTDPASGGNFSYPFAVSVAP